MPKAKRNLSRAPLTCRKVGDLFYADVQSVKPTNIKAITILWSLSMIRVDRLSQSLS